jgi:serine/threonine protein kinase
LRHPGIATLYDFLEHNGQGCIIMEFIDGPTVAEYIQSRGPLKESKALDILRQVSEAVRYLHGQGIIHRDLKPANIKLSPDGTVKLLDFGIAHSLRSLTNERRGSIVGTFEYSAPECLAGRRADQRSDIWSLGVLLYEMTTGRLPFAGSSVTELTRQIHTGRFVPVSNRKLDHLLSRCLQKDPLRRFADIQALQAGLSVRTPSKARFKPTRNLKIRMLAIAILAVIALAFAWRFNAPVSKPQVQPAAMKAINIEAVNGPAEVFRDGRDLGSTPIRLEEHPGEHVSLLLKREGFADLPIDFDVTERSYYSYVLHEAQAAR